MNLANVSKAYPVPSDLNLKGLLTADITTSFDMASIEKEQYTNTKTEGRMSLRDFEYSSEDFANPIKLSTTALTFTPNNVSLNQLEGSTGQTDFNAQGTIDNLLGYMFNDENVKGDFTLSSNIFALSDFMVEETESVPVKKMIRKLKRKSPIKNPVVEKKKSKCLLFWMLPSMPPPIKYFTTTSP